jgi:hypothetical protein
LKITSLPFHTGEVGIAYTTVLFGAAGGTPPYSWALSAGTLPGGLNLTSGGQLGGTPSATGHPSLTVHVTDSAGHAATAPGTFTVYAALGATQPCASLCSVEQGCTVCGAFGHVSGGVGPYHYAITADNRPDGMGVSGLTLTGAFPPPGPLGQFNVTVRVSDKLGAARNVTGQWFVYQHIAISATSASCSGFAISGCTTQVQYTGGTPNGAPTVKVTDTGTPTLPKGSTFTASNGVVSVSIAGSGCKTIYGLKGYNSVVTLVLVDQSACGVGSNCSSGNLSLTIRLLVC